MNDRVVERIRSAAAELSGTPASLHAEILTPGEVDVRRPRRSISIVAIGLVAAGLVGLAALSRRTVTSPATSPTSTDDSAPTLPTRIEHDPTTSARPLPNDRAPSTTVPSSISPSSAVSEVAVPEVDGLVRPIVDPTICTPVSALEHSGTAGRPVRFFGRQSSLPIPTQVIGNPTGDLTTGYAMVQRYFADQRIGRFGDLVDVNGISMRMFIGSDRQGEVSGLLPDGSELYLRSRDLDRETLIAYAKALSARPVDVAVPGFDVVGDLPAHAQLLAESDGHLPESHTSTSECSLKGPGTPVTVMVGQGDPVFLYYAGLEMTLPLLRRVGDGVWWYARELGAFPDVFGHLRSATPDEWKFLLQAPTLLDRGDSPPTEKLVRPIADPKFCTPISAREGSAPSGRIVSFFTRHSSKPIPTQIVGDPNGDISVGYALVQRYFTDQSLGRPGDPVDINGLQMTVFVGPGGQGQVSGLLPDGSEMYIRSRQLNRATLIAYATALVPRPTDAPIPGFDVVGDLPGGATLIAESDGTLGESRSVSSECVMKDSGMNIHVGVDYGDPVFLYGRGVDWLPLLVLRREGDGVLYVLENGGFPGVLDHLRNATPQEWARLLASPTIAELDASSATPPTT